MAVEERNKVELWAKAIEQISGTNDLGSEYLNFLMEVTSKNTTIPIIVVNADGTLNSDANITYNEARKEEVLQKETKKDERPCCPHKN
ncbi:hypothetical protein [uncultured Draconibacterium sp.]|uniref:hypothetical protein n=1 Tax=uncultured Draconibacterium sp. TaxID=1573823 RepID=UPI00321641F2